MIQLQVVDHTGEMQIYSFNKKRIDIGRLPQNDVILLAHTIRRRHAIIEYTDGQHILTDTDSAVPTCVNGKVLDDGICLQNNDEISIHPFTLIVKFTDQ